MPDKVQALAEPWLRGTLSDVPAVPRGVLHALELAGEDVERWCGKLNDEELNKRPGSLAPVAFHIRHLARSLDRLLTYAEGASLNDNQMKALKSEMDPGATHHVLFAEFCGALATSATRIRHLAHSDMEASRTVGRKGLPTTLGGLLVHIADHTQRHVGQVITTAKIVQAQSS